MPRKSCAWRSRRALAVAIESLESRQLFSALAASSPVLVFNASVPGFTGGGVSSRADTLTLTNTGAAAISFPAGALSIVKDPADANDESAQFAIAGGTLPASLAPGQSTQLQLDYTASVANSVQSALLQITSSDPAGPLTVQLHGLGTTGFFGTDEPSLANILRAFDIPTIVGAGPNDSNASNSQYPITPDPSSQEVPMQRLVKAGPGPVMITALASFDTNTQPAVRLGYYTPAEPNTASELFTIAQTDSQTVNPTALGATVFDPGGGAFGLYATFPGISTSSGVLDTHYSETSLNTALDPSHPIKFRFFPLENPDGTLVPNAYVVAAEDFNSTQFNSFTNFVGIIRNVMPAPDEAHSPVIGVTNPYAVPGTSTVVFNRIQNLNPTDPAGFVDAVHDTTTLQISNTGDQPLVINSFTLSDTTNWELVNPPALPVSIAPGGSLGLTVKFIAQTVPPHSTNLLNDTSTVNNIPVNQAGGVWNATLTINSNDPLNAATNVSLAGWWQYMSENENEPGLQTMVNDVFGLGTEIFPTSPEPQLVNKGQFPYYGEEVYSDQWALADPTLPVSVVQLAAFHNQFDATTGIEPTPTFAWYTLSGTTRTVHSLFKDAAGNSQSFFPLLKGSTTASAKGSFSPGPTSFGLDLDGEFSQNSLNTTDISLGRTGHAVRFYPVRDAQGNLVPNTWIVTMDYQDGSFDNSDFQDLVYIVSNIHPAIQAPAPTDLQATASELGAMIQWAPVNDSTLIGYNVYRSNSQSGPWAKLNNNPFSGTSFIDDVPGTGTVYYRVSAVDSAGESLAPQEGVVTIAPVAAADILQSLDINTGLVGQTAVITPGSAYDVTGAGGDIAGTNADGLRFVYEPVTGDFDAVVQIPTLSNSANTKAGLMVRASLDAGSQMVFSGATAASGYRFSYRTAADQVGVFNSVGRVSYPNVWVRLVRSGDVFTAYYSTNGSTWIFSGTLTLSLPTTLYLGMAISSHDVTETATADFRNFHVTNTPPTTGGGGTGAGTGTGSGGTGTGAGTGTGTGAGTGSGTGTGAGTGTGSGTGTGGTTGTTPPTLAQQVLLDKAALIAAQRSRTQQIKTARQTLRADQKSYNGALHALLAAERAAKRSGGSVDSTLDAAVTRLLSAIQLDKSNETSVQSSGAAAIAAARAKLATDEVALRNSRRHK